MSKLKFTTEHFEHLDLNDDYQYAPGDIEKIVAETAQAVYDKHVEGLPKVYGRKGDVWDSTEFKWKTHAARLEAVSRIVHSKSEMKRIECLKGEK